MLYQEGVEACGLDVPLACRVSHEELEAFLAREVRRYYDYAGPGIVVEMPGAGLCRVGGSQPRDVRDPGLSNPA